MENKVGYEDDDEGEEEEKDVEETAVKWIG